MKLKSLAVAVALAAGSLLVGQANAASINIDNGHIQGGGTGAGGLFLSVLYVGDTAATPTGPVQAQSFVLNLGVDANTFRTAAYNTANHSFTDSDVTNGLGQFLGINSNKGLYRWNVGAISNVIDFTAVDNTTALKNYGVITSVNGTINTTNNQAGVQGIQTAQDNASFYLDNVNGFAGPGVSIKPSSGVSDNSTWVNTNVGQAFHNGGFWGSAWGGSASFNSEGALNKDLAAYFVTPDTAGVLDPSFNSVNLKFPGVFNLSSAGTLTYTAAAPVPVPAAVWLMGSALIGMCGISRRRNDA